TRSAVAPSHSRPRGPVRRPRRRGDRRRGAREDSRSGMTRRGRAVLALGLVVYLAAWVFGSRSLYPVATGLVLAVALALGWVRLSARPPRVARHGATRDVVEGDDVRVDLVVEATSPVAPPTLVAHERPGRLAERRVELYRAGRRRFAGGFELRAVPRGRHAFDAVRLT